MREIIEETEQRPEAKRLALQQRLDALMQKHEQVQERVRQAHRVALTKSAELEKATRQLTQCRAEIHTLQKEMGEVRGEMRRAHKGRAFKVDQRQIAPIAHFRV